MASRGRAALHHGKADFVGRSAASAEAFGIPHETLSGEEAMRRYPQIVGAEGAQAYFEPGGGFVHPERCISVQLDLARRRGARVGNREVRSVSQQGLIVTVETDAGVIEADRAVIAAGAWTAGLMGAPFDSLLTVSRQVLHWFPVEDKVYAPGRFPTAIWMHGDSTEDYFYAFPSLPGTRLLKAATEQYSMHTTPEELDRIVAPTEGRELHRKHLARRLSGIGAEPAKSVACLYTVTPDSGFIVDQHPRMDRVTVTSACSGHGFKHSAGIGEAVAESMVSQQPSASLAPFSFDRYIAGRSYGKRAT